MYRTLGLGYANLGALVMASGLSYDSEEGRALCAAITSIMTGRAYATSAEMAGELGKFPGYETNRESMLRVIRNHRRAAHGKTTGYEDLATLPVPLDLENCPDTALVSAAQTAWDDAVEVAGRYDDMLDVVEERIDAFRFQKEFDRTRGGCHDRKPFKWAWRKDNEKD